MRLGTTTFSFTNEWLTRRFTLEQLLERAAGLGPGIEVVGYQVWRRYPTLSNEDVLEFRRLCDRLELEPAALGSYVDLARRVDRMVTVHEAVELLEAQVETAARLGFPVLRLHAGIPVVALERAASRAERHGVALATEVQGDQTPDHPAVEPILASRDRLDSAALALTLDFSVAMRAVPGDFVQALGRLGIATDDVEALVALWESGAPTHELFAAIGELGAPAAALDEARAGFVRFGRQDPSAWAPLVSAVTYTHAKFWGADEEGDDPSVRTADMLEVLAEGGYGGVVASEWGGSAWADADEVDAFEVVGRHHGMCSRLLADSEASGGPNEAALPVVVGETT
jgi:sugar phosphate isomerase/epimerase